MLTSVLAEADIRIEICADIFAAVEKSTKQSFSCILVDWAEQPEAGFLLRRARESRANSSAAAIAIVDDEPPAEQQREHRLEFLLYRPIVTDEARSVLAKARQKMQLHSAVFSDDVRGSTPQGSDTTHAENDDDPNLLAMAAEVPEPHQDAGAAPPRPDPYGPEYFSESLSDEVERADTHFLTFRSVCAFLLALVAAVLLWLTSSTWQYLARTPEGTFHVLKDSVASLFFVNRPAVATAAQPDAYFSRTPARDAAVHNDIGLVTADIILPDAPRRLPPAFDFPLPTPELERAPVAVKLERPRIPDSIRNSAPISSPVVLTVGPAQMVPVSTPPPSAPVVNTNEPVVLSEESARTLLTHTVAPVYPPDAMAQRLQGAVVLQATIGRDGSVRDVKIVRGYFLLGRAAVAAVKQWRFRPYNVDGRAAETQTLLTLNFSLPAS